MFVWEGMKTMRTVLIVTAAISLTGCEFRDLEPSDRYQSDFHYTFEMQPTGRINAESFNGEIDISGWDQNKVEITGTKYASTEALRDAVKIDVHNTPEMVEIRAVKPSSMDRGNMGARFTIHVPRKAMLDRITTSNGPVKVKDVGSAAHLKTSNGSINVTNVDGDVDAHTSNSSVEADTIRGGATLKTSNGRIRAEDVSGALEAETSNNSITARLDKSPTAATKLVTSNGAIELTLGSAPKGDIRAETRNNGIKLHLPADAAAHVVADTSNGSISSDFSVASKGDSDEDKKRQRHMDGMIGGGGPMIELSTNNGSIHIFKGSGI
jgi:Putative adhesin